MEVTPFRPEHVPEAAALFVDGFHRQRLLTPALPSVMEQPEIVARMLDRRLGAGHVPDGDTGAATRPGVVALDGGRLVGYLAWMLVDRFRGSDRRGAYVPEWGHASEEHDRERIYRQMYRVAAALWAAAGCGVHAVTLLACDRIAETVWFWNGFGLTVVDAIRPMRPLDAAPASSLRICAAGPDDAAALSDLDAEHWQHYTRSPIFMPVHHARSADENLEFLARPGNSVWLAVDGGALAAFMRFEAGDFDGVTILEAENGVGISGAYVRPAYRGRNVATGVLDAALRHYADREFAFCGVNFESFNPEAASFWMRYFDPVCLSVVRVPEST